MNYAKVVLETELKSLERREFPWLIKVFGGDKAHYHRIADIRIALLILNGEIRVSSGEFCTCKHVSIVFYGQICDACGKPIVLQNSQERTE